MEIDRIKVKEYYKVENKDAYDFAMKFSFIFIKPENVFNAEKLEDKTYGEVKKIQSLSQVSDFVSDVEIFFIMTGKDPYEQWLDEYTRQLHYIRKELDELVNKERMLLTTPPTSKEQSAGLERFDGLGLYLQERSLTNNDITKLAAIRKMKYKECFLELYTRKQESEYNKAYSKLK